MRDIGLDIFVYIRNKLNRYHRRCRSGRHDPEGETERERDGDRRLDESQIGLLKKEIVLLTKQP